MFNLFFSKTAILATVGLLMLSASVLSQETQALDPVQTAAMTVAPPNDNLANAEVVVGIRVKVVGTNAGATKEAGEPAHGSNPGGKSVWYRWTAPRDGAYVITTNRGQASFDTLIGVYSVNQGTIQANYGGNDNINAPYDMRSFMKLNVSQGVTYYIAIDGAATGGGPADEGQFVLDIQRRFNYQGADYDADGMTDISVFRPSTGAWYVFESSSGQTVARQWGMNGDIPVVSMASGATANDYGVFRPSTGTFYGLSGNSYYALNWGSPGDIPVPAQYLGGYSSNTAVFRPSNGTWYIYYDAAHTLTYQFGIEGDIPVPGQYSADQFADVAVFRPSTGVWYFRKRSSETATEDTFSTVKFGQPGDKPVPGDYDGDGVLDIAVYRPSTGTWWVLPSINNHATTFSWGTAEDTPTTGDFDGDGRFDYAVFRPSTGVWYVYRGDNNITQIMNFGLTGDIPVTANKTF